ncbi:MAG: ABC transporter ATP-binding protein [Clostridiales bacterium]|nr:ABC transporter ATP-binding protein [Clostridiales bacterium]
MIKIDNLTQIYPSGKGIFNVSFEVKKGEVFGYLGPNGAGKTTTIRNILGFSNANEGIVTIKGIDCRLKSAVLQKSIGYLPGEIAFFDNMTGVQFLNFLCEMKNLKDLSKRKELIDLFELDATGRIKKMSKGMKQKLGIVAAFMHDPEIFILDEPTSGLDPLMQNKFMKLLAEEKKKGKTILMSSHIFEEVDKICDRVGIIKEGKIVAIEDIVSLKAMKTESFMLRTSDMNDYDLLLSENLEVEKINGSTLIVTMKDDYAHLFSALSKCHITSFEVKEQSLEDLFMKYYGKVVANE